MEGICRLFGDSYNKLTKNKKEHIKQGEVKAVLEKSKQDDENMFQDKHVYLKTATGMCKFAIKKRSERSFICCSTVGYYTNSGYE